ncbi:MAG: VWA domain-containing protein [Candidatus Neomarinimicrobiota bacterium]|nr:VWA domain-containing protein [Candidatus Neomarinimicrobiota bacterium]
MEFLNPNFLYLLAVLFVLIVMRIVFLSKRNASLQVSNVESLKTFFNKGATYKIFLLNSLFIIALILFIVSLARPRISSSDKLIKVDVVDIILVLDTSSSMLAEDFKPNRLEAVKKAAQDFIENRNGDRIGLLVFGKETFIQCPLTIDYSVLNNLLTEVTVIDRKYDGTAIGIAIANGINRLRANESKSKVMILLSDGSNNSGAIDPISAAKMAKEYNIKIYTIGAGTRQAVTYIPDRGYIRNEIDEDTLKKIAAETGGKYFRATDKESLSNVYEEINELEKSEITVSYFTQYKEIYLYFLCAGFVILILYQLLNIIYFRRII